MVEKGSDKHIAYAASKAALDNMTRSFARKLAPEVKVNAIAPALIIFNRRRRGLSPAGAGEIADEGRAGRERSGQPVNYLMESRYVTGRTHGVDGGRPLR